MLGQKLYVFGGVGEEQSEEDIASIEVIDTSNDDFAWDKFKNAAFTPRFKPMVIPYNQSQIIIAGGLVGLDCTPLADIFAFNVNEHSS